MWILAIVVLSTILASPCTDRHTLAGLLLLQSATHISQSSFEHTSQNTELQRISVCQRQDCCGNLGIFLFLALILIKFWRLWSSYTLWSSICLAWFQEQEAVRHAPSLPASFTFLQTASGSHRGSGWQRYSESSPHWKQAVPHSFAHSCFFKSLQLKDSMWASAFLSELTARVKLY